MKSKRNTMKTVAKGFITASVILFGISLTGPGSEFLWGFLKPLSALLFGAFFITNLLAIQYAEYDVEHDYRIALAKKVREREGRRDSTPEMIGGLQYEIRAHKA